MNQDPVECRPLLPDQFTAVVRVPGADPLFRSRVAREGQALVEEKGQGKGEDAMRSARRGVILPIVLFILLLLGLLVGVFSFRVHADAAATHGMSERLRRDWRRRRASSG